MISKKGILVLRVLELLNKKPLRHKEIISSIEVDRAKIDLVLKELKENNILSNECKNYTVSQNVKTMPLKNVMMLVGGLEKSGVFDIDKLHKNYLERTLVGRLWWALK